jgi:hypothetical protein
LSTPVAAVEPAIVGLSVADFARQMPANVTGIGATNVAETGVGVESFKVADVSGVGRIWTAEPQETDVAGLELAVVAAFPGSMLVEAYKGSLTFKLPTTSFESTAAVFAAVEVMRTRWDISDYQISQTTLESVFCQVAKEGGGDPVVRPFSGVAAAPNYKIGGGGGPSVVANMAFAIGDTSEDDAPLFPI